MDKNILFKTVNSNGIYSCDEIDITVEEWKTVLQDSFIYENYKLIAYERTNYRAYDIFVYFKNRGDTGGTL